MAGLAHFFAPKNQPTALIETIDFLCSLLKTKSAIEVVKVA